MAIEIIGNGLLAKSFKHTKSDNCLFFCSGVSKSNEINIQEFKREEVLLKKYLEMNHNKCFVYFSSILAPLQQNSYFEHKMKMEKIIVESSSNYWILRLPQVAGPVLNTTLLSTFVKNIYEGNEFILYKNAERTFIDIDHVVEFFDIVYSLPMRNKIINLLPEYTFKLEELVNLIEIYLNKKAVFIPVNKGSKQECSVDSNIESLITSDFFKKYPNYLENVIKKYVPEIVRLIELEKS